MFVILFPSVFLLKFNEKFLVSLAVLNYLDDYYVIKICVRFLHKETSYYLHIEYEKNDW